jgi:hypothetical protein
MNTNIPTKINQLLQDVPRGGWQVAFRADAGAGSAGWQSTNIQEKEEEKTQVREAGVKFALLFLPSKTES